MAGTYWKKFLARNPNYQDRPIRIYEGFLGLPKTDFQLRWQGTIENIIQDNDFVTIECTDPLKSIADFTLPEKIEVSIAADITTASTELAVRHSSKLSTYIYFRLEDEIIEVNTKNTSIDSVNVTRGSLETVIAEHKADRKLEPIWHAGPENPFNTMLFLTSFCGISSANNTTAWTAARDWPGDDKNIEAYISEPTECDKLLFELADLTNCRIWYDEAQKINCKRVVNNDPNRAYINLTDSANIIENSGSVNYRALERISRYWMYWGLNPIGQFNNTTSYSYLSGAIDLDSESSNFYGSIVESTFFNRWSHSSEGPGHTESVMWAKSYVNRMLFNRSDPLPLINLKVEIKDSTLMTGDYVEIDTDEIEEVTGQHSNNKYIITYRDPATPDGFVSLKAQALPNRKIAIIASTTMADDWNNASTSERIYAYIANSSGSMGNNDETAGYCIY
jgi:hypothetical protein